MKNTNKRHTPSALNEQLNQKEEIFTRIWLLISSKHNDCALPWTCDQCPYAEECPFSILGKILQGNHF